MLTIGNVEIMGLDNAIVASGYPKNFAADYNLERAKKLGSAKSGSGHDCFLKGIVVSFDVVYPEYWSPQFQRYHFADIVSSQSKMHMIMQFDIASQCNKYVNPIIVRIINYLKEQYRLATTPEKKYFYFMCVISNLPMGFEKKMRLVTNYLQLKTIYQQRKNHKLKEDWGAFCDWILSLPKFIELTGV